MTNTPDESKSGYTDENRKQAIAAGNMLEVAITEMVASFGQGLSAVREGTVGYKNAAVAAGFSETAAEQMAVGYHAFLIQACGANLFPKSGGSS